MADSTICVHFHFGEYLGCVLVDVQENFDRSGGSINESPTVVADVYRLEAKISAHLGILPRNNSFWYNGQLGRLLKLGGSLKLVMDTD
jgi:uncharacterized protein (DUF3820 family)